MEKHDELLHRLKKHLSATELQDLGPQLPFQGDEVDDLICKVVRNLDLAPEDEATYREIAARFLPEGVSICRFRELCALKGWAPHLQQQCGYQLKQDENAFFLEREDSHGRPPEQRAYFHHLEFPYGDTHRSATSGAWWGVCGKAMLQKLTSEHCSLLLGSLSREPSGPGHILGKAG